MKMLNSHSEKIRDIAAAWVVKAQLAPLTAAEAAELAAWLEASSIHRGAYIRANAVRVTVDRIAAMNGGKVPSNARHSFYLSRIAPPLLAAASVAALALAVLWEKNPGVSGGEQRYATAPAAVSAAPALQDPNARPVVLAAISPAVGTAATTTRAAVSRRAPARHSTHILKAGMTDGGALEGRRWDCIGESWRKKEATDDTDPMMPYLKFANLD